MKKSIYLLLIVLVTGLVSCENKDAEFEHLDYYTLKTSFVYPDNARDNYVFLFNGDTLGGYSVYVPANEAGTLEVVEKGQSTPEFSQELTLSEHTALQFIKLTGQPVALYEADQYTTFSVNLSYTDGEDPSLYTILFNGQELTNNETTYIRADQLTGTLEIQKEGEVVSSQQVTITPEKALNYLQLSETEYLIVPVSDETAPEEPMSKVRFFYFSEGIPEAEEVELTLYYMYRDYVTFENVATFTMKPGEITDYVLVDWTKTSDGDGQRMRAVAYDLKNLTTGEILVDHANQDGGNFYGNISDNFARNTYKFATVQLINNGTYGIIPIGEIW